MRSESLLVAALLVTAACDNTAPTTEEPTFEAVVEQVLEKKCTFGQCHSSETAAASLDLTPKHACKALVNKPSCLFPDRMRVSPGDPDASFFFHKVTGQGLDETPTGDCGSGSGATTKTNLLMPFGAAELPDAELQLVHGWIAAGAPCEGEDPTPTDTAPSIAALTATSATPLAGEIVSFTVTLDRAAPDQGQLIELVTDETVLTSPTQVIVRAGEKSVQFDAFAVRPSARFAMRARAGESTKQLVLRVVGLDIAEVLADPQGDDDQLQWIKLRNRGSVELDLTGYRLQAGQASYGLVTVALTGSIPAGGCVVIGGPSQSALNSEPIFGMLHDFDPNLPHHGMQATGFAVFDSNAAPMGGVATPVDTMLVGTHNNSALLGPDAEVASPHCGTPIQGQSAQRTAAGACATAQPQPRACF